MRLRRYMSAVQRVRSASRVGLAKLGYGSRPSFLVAGVQKCGTKALEQYLGQHPQIMPARVPEVHFFDGRNYTDRGMAWYASQFPSPRRLGDATTFEATPAYFYYPKAMKRIRDFSPEMKLIVILRDPIARAYSAWNMFRQFHVDRHQMLKKIAKQQEPVAVRGLSRILDRETYPSFSEAIDIELEIIDGSEYIPEPSFIRRGFYHRQIEFMHTLFPSDQTLILRSGDLRADTGASLDRIVDFLGLDPFRWDDDVLRPVHARPYVSSISDEDRARLLAIFTPEDDLLPPHLRVLER